MIINGNCICPKCGGYLKYYDTVQRIKRTKNHKSKHISVDRYRCESCGSVHRNIPEDMLPYKQYEAEVFFGVLEGLITEDTLGFEDYPCKSTVRSWFSQNLQGLLWK